MVSVSITQLGASAAIENAAPGLNANLRSTGPASIGAPASVVCAHALSVRSIPASAAAAATHRSRRPHRDTVGADDAVAVTRALRPVPVRALPPNRSARPGVWCVRRGHRWR
ncbi:Uncharacterised protein [Mycobacteroides abscessus subsp. abscessus]|nr:Uncharacterised protein [Mycobacteroides abscessus subsp. abscessus]